MKDIYITKYGKLKRKENTLYFVDLDGNKTYLPVENIENIFCLSNVSITSSAIKLILKKNIKVHFFQDDFYLGSLLPKQKHQAGFLIIKQVQAYLNKEKREYIALSIVDATRYNMVKVVEKYDELKDHTFTLRNLDVFRRYNELLQNSIKNVNYMDIIRGIESEIWSIFYDAIDKILLDHKIEKRTRRPPKNEANAIISFCNSLLYVITLSEIWKTHLNPTISFLHEPFERRYSLALDLAEPFKPIITFRTLIWLVNQKMLKERHFERKFDGIFLSREGKKLVITEFNKKLNTTIKLKGSVRRSIRSLIRKQAYDLERYLIEEVRFEGFKLRY